MNKLMGDFTQSRFATRDGPQIEYRDYPPQGEPIGMPVLCLHGLTRNVRDFDELAPMIADLGRRVIVASQRGRGGSDPDQPERYTPGVYTSDMLALLDHLGVEQAVFIGTSMGGLMTMIAAMLAPHRLGGAVLNDVGPELDPVGIARIQSYVGIARPVATWQEAMAYCRETNGAAFPTETSDEFWLDFAKKLFREVETGRIVLDYDPAIARLIVPGSEDLADLWPLFEALRSIPTLIVRGEISDILMPSTIEEMRRRKPDLQVATVPNVGHAPFLTEPAAWSAVKDFLAERAR